MALPTSITLEVVTPAGLLFRDEVEEVIAPGELGYFGVRPGHTPFLSTLAMGEISYRQNGVMKHLTCFWGFCEVLPDRVNILAELGERAEDIDKGQVELALANARERMKQIANEEGYKQAHEDYMKAVTRLAVASRQR